MHTHARMCGHACGLFCLEQVRQQLDSPEVEITLAVLKLAKRFHETTSFEADTGIKQACLPHSAMRRLSYFNSPARLSYFNSPARLFTRPATRATTPLGCTTWPHGSPAQAMKTVSNYNILLREFPINELLTATDIPPLGLCALRACVRAM